MATHRSDFIFGVFCIAVGVTGLALRRLLRRRFGDDPRELGVLFGRIGVLQFFSFMSFTMIAIGAVLILASLIVYARF
jgi:hypothetical protein